MTAVEEAQALASPPEGEVEFRHIVRKLHLPRLRVTPEEYELEKRIPTMSEEELKRQPWGFIVSGRLAPSATSSVDMRIRMRIRPTMWSATLSDSGMQSSPPTPSNSSWTTVFAFVRGAWRFKLSSCSLRMDRGTVAATFRHSARAKAAITAP